MSSPSRPASHPLMTSWTSARFSSRLMRLKRAWVFSIGLRSKCSGMIGRFAKLHLPRFLSISPGRQSSTRWPMAEVITNSSFSKASFFFGIFPRARARSAATLGFSAMTRAFGMLLSFHKAAAGKLLDQLSHLKGEQRRRDLLGWQPAFGNDCVHRCLVISDRIANGLLFGRQIGRWGGTREIRRAGKEESKVIEDILCAGHKFGALLNQTV